MMNPCFYICFDIFFIYTACMVLEIGIISLNNGFLIHIIQIKQYQSFDLTYTWRPSARNQSSAIGSLISRKQQLDCWSRLSLRGRLGPTAALISSVIILTVFAQPCWHISQVRQFCFRIFHNCLHTFFWIFGSFLQISKQKNHWQKQTPHSKLFIPFQNMFFASKLHTNCHIFTIQHTDGLNTKHCESHQ